ncbi:hypothetical protein PYW07_010172 [Mythimna separata]|uniref:PHD-type domain-containing protein n=1 Tax=Mythimna separata TaxID=271217 RepID=A0AAD7YGZ2_MYTSE|nr:hypothetical protein PYW07_010172 [Mythimna separata]
MSNKKQKPIKCTKTKNACKYCLEQVTHKTGLQCQGACKKWAHYDCLNYTPGKILDIKAGIIKVMCPCPDCDTSQVKEYLTNPPFSCTKNQCPANNAVPIRCDSNDCPQNADRHVEECSNKTCEKQPHAPPIPPVQAPCPPRMAVRPQTPPVRSQTPPVRPQTPSYRPKSEKMEAKIRENKKIMPIRSSDSCDIPDCPNRLSNSSSDEETKRPKTQASMVHVLQEMCGTIGKLSLQIQDLIGKVNKM